MRKCWGLTVLSSKRGRAMAGCKLEPEKFKLELKYKILTGWCLSMRGKKALKVPREAGGCGDFTSSSVIFLKEMLQLKQHKCAGEILGLRTSSAGILQAERKNIVMDFVP